MSILIRKPKGLESFFIDLAYGGCDMTIRVYLRLNKKPSQEKINKAVNTVLKSHIGTNLKYKRNAWYSAEYTHKCRVYELSDKQDPYTYKTAPVDYLSNTISHDFLHTPGDDWYICFGFFHGAIDGRSAVQFVYNFFEALNGEKEFKNEYCLSPHELVDYDENDLTLERKNVFTVLPGCKPLSWIPKEMGDEKCFVLRSESCVSAVAARVSSNIGKLFTEKSAKMFIPVDVRRYYDGEEFLMGNIFIPLFIEGKRGKRLEDVRSEIVECVKSKKHLTKIARRLTLYNVIPPFIRSRMIKFLIPVVMGSKKFIYSALVSSIGKIDSERLKSNDLFVKDVAVTFISFPFAAFSAISVQYDGHTNTTISWNSGRVPEKTAHRLIGKIRGNVYGKVKR